MKIQVRLHSIEQGDYVNAVIAGKYLKPEVDFNNLLQSIRNTFTYEVSEDIREETGGKFNIVFIYNPPPQDQLFAYLNIWQQHKLKWMLGEHHLQKHWKDYATWIGVPLATYLVGRWSGLWHALVERIHTISQ